MLWCMDCSSLFVKKGMKVEMQPPQVDQFADLYRDQHASQVRRASLILGSTESGEDVVHDAFVRLHARWAEVDEPGPYLSRMVLNGCRDQLRRQRRLQDRIPLLGSRLRSPAPEQEVLWDVLQRLPFNQRTAVVLRFYEGRTEQEIAEILECKVGSVGPWIKRGLSAMRKELS